jgi:hypothetical protein
MQTKELCIKEIGLMTSLMVLEHNNLQMVINIKATLKMAIKMGKVYLDGKMEWYIKATLN